MALSFGNNVAGLLIHKCYYFFYQRLLRANKHANNKKICGNKSDQYALEKKSGMLFSVKTDFKFHKEIPLPCLP